MVTTQLIDPHARQRQRPIEVDFRVFGSRGYFSIGDVTVLDVDLAITAQDQFHEYLWGHNDSVRALTAELNRRTDRMTATGLVGDK
jgi:ABC-type transporter MlaC component